MTAQITLNGKRILLVDDQIEVRETVKMLLDLDGHSVTEAANGREALDRFASGRFDLVITDYAMPEMLGDELAARIRRGAPSQPILMITGSAHSSDISSACVDEILNKPFAMQDLRQAVDRVACLSVAKDVAVLTVPVSASQPCDPLAARCARL